MVKNVMKKQEKYLTQRPWCVKINCCLEAIIMTKKEEVISLASQYIRDVPGFPKPGVTFKDIVPVFEHPEYFVKVFEVMVDEIKKSGIEFDKIICPEARGFLFGPGLGLMLNKGVVLARKPGKLPCPGISLSYDLEYGSTTLVISKDSIKPSERLLVVDDLLATGGSGKAVCELAEKSGGVVAGVLFFIELTPLNGRKNLEKYPVLSIVPVDAY